MVTATQINIELPNVPGALAKLCDLLRSADVNIEALFCTEGKDVSVLHLIVDDTETAKILLQPLFAMTTTTMLAFQLKNKPGAVGQVARLCTGAGISIGQIYCSTTGKEATVYVSVSDIERAQTVFREGAAMMPALAMAK